MEREVLAAIAEYVAVSEKFIAVLLEKGGPTSGNFGHGGRPGLVGGSEGSGNLPFNPHGDQYFRALSPKGQEFVKNACAKFGVSADRIASEVKTRLSLPDGSPNKALLAEGAKWYPMAHELTVKIADSTKGMSHPVTPEQVATAIARLSPQTPWETNAEVAAHLSQWMASGKGDGMKSDAAALAFKMEWQAQGWGGKTLGSGGTINSKLAMMNNLVADGAAVLNGEKTIEESLTSPKQRSFANNIMLPGQTEDVTVDVQMQKSISYSCAPPPLPKDPASAEENGLPRDRTVTNFFEGKSVQAAAGPGYVTVAAGTRIAAVALGVSPDTVQAAYWIVVQDQTPPNWPRSTGRTMTQMKMPLVTSLLGHAFIGTAGYKGTKKFSFKAIEDDANWPLPVDYGSMALDAIETMTDEEYEAAIEADEMPTDSEAGVDTEDAAPTGETKGGSGSGNFGHAGRAGEVGGSAEGGSAIGKSEVEAWLADSKNKVITYHVTDDAGARSLLKGGVTRMGMGALGPGFYTSSKSGSESLSHGATRELQVAVRLEHPLVGSSTVIQHYYDKMLAASQRDPNGSPEKLRQAMLKDYDGFIVHNVSWANNADWVVAFKPESVRFVDSTKGGPGSGNFEHSGRPGEVGGSGEGGEVKPQPVWGHGGTVLDETAKMKAIGYYQGRGYGPINGSLRRGEVNLAHPGRGGFFPDISASVLAIDAAMKPLSEGRTVFRSIGKTGVEALFPGASIEDVAGNNLLETSKLPIGTIISDKGFVSTSTDANDVVEAREVTSVLAEISVPAGTLAVDIATGNAEYDVEKECLLARGQSFRVDSISERPAPVDWPGHITYAVHLTVVASTSAFAPGKAARIADPKRFVWEADDFVITKPGTKGGPTSGNFGHAGRPGEVGGSGPGGGTLPPISDRLELTTGLRPEIAARATKVMAEVLKADRAGLATNMPPNEHDPRSMGRYSPERQAQHDKIINAILDENKGVPEGRQAWIMGGLGGAGKTTLLTAGAAGTSNETNLITMPDGSTTTAAALFGIETGPGGRFANAINVNADDLTERMAAAGMMPLVDHLAPMELSYLAHEEASQMSHELADRVIANGQNMIWDVTLGSRNSGSERVAQLKAQGYHVTGVFVDVSVDHSIEAALGRYQRGVDDHAAGKGYGGRYVPPSLIEQGRDGTEAYSKNRLVFDSLTKDGVFDRAIVIDNEQRQRQVVSIR